MSQIIGVIPILATPFNKNGDINFKDYEKEYLLKNKPWGVILFSRNIKSLSQLKNLLLVPARINLLDVDLGFAVPAEKERIVVLRARVVGNFRKNGQERDSHHFFREELRN